MPADDETLVSDEPLVNDAPLVGDENLMRVDADHADGRAHGDEGELETPTKRDKLQKLLTRVRHLRLVSRFDANPGGFSAGDFEAIRLHKVQSQWYESLDLALAQAERSLMGMMECEAQFGGCCND